jgi:hypothetical protein
VRKYTIVILNQFNIKKIKLTKTILKKNHIRKQRKRKRKRKKTHVEKHYNNPQCFVRKTIVVILNQLNIKKIKSTKIILKKIIKKT